nr:unnamed protein product [Digitaria exilis]
MFRRKHAPDFNSNDAEQREAKITELKAALGPLSARGEKYCSEACLKRYLEARNWNVAKSRKMLEESLKWRAAYKPEDIRWNTSSHEGQIRFLVYTLENAIIHLPEAQEKMVIKVFLDPKTIEKVNFVYQKDEESMKVMYKYIDPEVLPVEFGGKSNASYNHEEYSELMMKDDIKTANFWADDAKTGHANPGVNETLVPDVTQQPSLLAAKAS